MDDDAGNVTAVIRVATPDGMIWHRDWTCRMAPSVASPYADIVPVAEFTVENVGDEDTMCPCIAPWAREHLSPAPKTVLSIPAPMDEITMLQDVMHGAALARPGLPERYSAEPDGNKMVITEKDTGRTLTVGLCDYWGAVRALEFVEFWLADPGSVVDLAEGEPRWLREFGPEYAVPPAITDEPGILDLSWHNDTCPQFANFGGEVPDDDRAVRMTIWVEHPDPEERESADSGGPARFTVVKDEPDGDVVYRGDDAEAALAAYRRKGM